MSQSGCFVNNREALEQEAIFKWRDASTFTYPGIGLMFAIPNGAYLQGSGWQRARQWEKLRKQGARPGVSDIFLPYPAGGYSGLWIELKAPKPHRSKVTEEQWAWLDAMNKVGYKAKVCYGAEEAIETIKRYMRAENG